MNKLIDGAYHNASGARNYKVHVASPGASAAPPMFVMLHGCDQDAADFAVGTRMNELVEECHGVVLYPEQCRLVNPLGCWNWYDTNHQSADQGEPSLIAGMTRQVMAEFSIDPRRVYVAGMSAGGAMAVILGQEYPDLYAAVGVHSGVASGVASDLGSALAAMTMGPGLVASSSTRTRTRNRRAVPTIVFHGDQDTVVHLSNGKAVHAQARRPTRRASPSIASTAARSGKTRSPERPGDRAFTRTSVTTDGVADAELWILHGAGHAWAGGSANGTYTDAIGPDASREMIRFFLQHTLDPEMQQRQHQA